MQHNNDWLKEAGFSDDEIRQVQELCEAADASGVFSSQAGIVKLNGQDRLVCYTIAVILDMFRPGCWLNRPRYTTVQTPKGCRKSKGKGKKRSRSRAPTGSRKGSPRRSDPNLIKVHLNYPEKQPGGPSGEFLWARRISKDTAKIANIPFMTSRLAYGDLVRIDSQGEILAVLEQGARTRSLIYADDEKHTLQEIRERSAKVHELLRKYDIETEGMIPGICAISVPRDIDDEQLAILAEQLDAQLIVHEDSRESFQA